MQDMKVSIVTVSYNQAQFLTECMESVLSQSYPNIEYIVIDGGSTDGSAGIIEAHAAKLSYWCSESDRGAAHALNKGFQRASGDVFAYLNSDDVLEHDAVERWIECFTRYPDVGVAYGDLKIIDSKGQPAHLPGRRVSIFRAGKWSTRNHASGAVPIPQQATAWRREVREKVGQFNEANRTCWDGEFFVQAALAGFRFHRINRVLARFRVHEASISGSGRTEDLYRADQARIDALWPEKGIRVPDWEKKIRRTGVRAERLLRGLVSRE